MTPARRLLAVLAAASCLPAPAQSDTRDAAASAPTSAPTSRPAEPPFVDDAAALALFRKAAADQTPGDPRFEIVDFQADVVATLYERGDDGVRRPRSAEVTEFWRREANEDGGRYRRDLFEPTERKSTIHGFDGGAFWEKLGTAAPRELSGADDVEMRRRLREELRRMNDLAASLVLRALDVPEARWAFAPERARVKTAEGDVAVRTVRRRLPGRRDEEFSFGEKAFGDEPPRTILVGVRRAKTTKAPEEVLAFAVHVMAGKDRGRIVAPLVVDTYEDGELALTARVRKADDLKLNVGLEDALFAPPRR